jgi:GTPase SAR1 family protein
MHQFFNAPEHWWIALKYRAGGRCVRFRDQELPPGAHPTQSVVGFEVDLATEAATLFIERGITYTGDDVSLCQWFADGQLRFQSFEELRGWVEGPLRAAYSPLRGLLREVDGPAEPVLWPFIGHEEDLERAEAALAQQYSPTAVLVVGPSGVGKTAFVRELARRSATRDPSAVWLDVAALTAVSARPSDRNERLHACLSSLLQGGLRPLVIAEDLHFCCGWPTDASEVDRRTAARGPAFESDPFASLLLRSLVDRGMKLCGTAPSSGLPAFREAQLRSRLTVVRLSPPPMNELQQGIIVRVARYLEQTLGVEIPAVTIRYLLQRLGTRNAPGGPIRVLERSVRRLCARELRVLSPDDVL